MAAKTMSLNDALDISQCQQSTGFMYPNDAKVFLSASDLRTVTSSKNPTIHTRAHSLEIPGSDADEDFLMIDDIDLEDTADILNIILEDIGQPEFPNELQAPMNLAGNKNHDTTTTESSGDVRLGVPLMCKMNNPRRLKRVSTKQKIDTLREEIHELTYQLHRLEYAASVKKKNATKRDMNELFRARLWKLIAGRQLEQRLRSEKENSKLRLMMEMQIQEAKKLRYVLKRRKNIEILQTTVQAKCKESGTCGSTTRPIKSDDYLFEQILSDLTIKTDSAFAEDGTYATTIPVLQ